MTRLTSGKRAFCPGSGGASVPVSQPGLARRDWCPWHLSRYAYGPGPVGLHVVDPASPGFTPSGPGWCLSPGPMWTTWPTRRAWGNHPLVPVGGSTRDLCVGRDLCVSPLFDFLIYFFFQFRLFLLINSGSLCIYTNLHLFITKVDHKIIQIYTILI